MTFARICDTSSHPYRKSFLGQALHGDDELRKKCRTLLGGVNHRLKRGVLRTQILLPLCALYEGFKYCIGISFSEDL